MGPQRPNLEEVVPKLLPSCLVVFEGLKRAYEARAEGDDDESSDEDDDEDDDGMLRGVVSPPLFLVMHPQSLHIKMRLCTILEHLTNFS